MAIKILARLSWRACPSLRALAWQACDLDLACPSLRALYFSVIAVKPVMAAKPVIEALRNQGENPGCARINRSLDAASRNQGENPGCSA